MNNSLRGEIEALCQKMFAYGVEVGKLNKYHRTSKETVIAAEEIDQILNLVASKMPEKKEKIPEHQNDYINKPYIVGEINGHNKCLDSVKSILKGEKQ